MGLRLHTYSSWYFKPEFLPELAMHDNIVLPEHFAVTPAEIKAINPTAKVYRLYDLCVKNDWDKDDVHRQTPLSWAEIDTNGWWLKDTEGKIARETDRQLFLDVGQPGFKETFLSEVLARNESLGFGGFVFDYLRWDLQIWSKRLGYTLADYPTNSDWIEYAWKPFFQHVTRRLREVGYGVIGNCGGEYATSNPTEVWQRSMLDGVVYEQGAFDWYPGAYLSEATLLRRNAGIKNDPLEVWVSEEGLRADVPDYDGKALLSLAYYYISLPDTDEFRDRRSYHLAGDFYPRWREEWALCIGDPREPAQEVAPLQWYRLFRCGKILCNYSEEPMPWSLRDWHVGQDGQYYDGKIEVPPRTGLLLKVK